MTVYQWRTENQMYLVRAHRKLADLRPGNDHTASPARQIAP